MPWLKCKICSADFYAKPRHIKRGWGKYCSNACYYKAMRNGKRVNCDICAKEVYRSLHELGVSQSKKYFCSKSCFAVWKNKNLFSGERHANWKGGETTYRNILIRNKTPMICKYCKNKDSRVLVAHHIDDNHKNNQLKNLVWLCCNCHFLIHHDIVEREKFTETLV